MKSLNDVLYAIIIISTITFATRAFSFVLFSKKKPPKYLMLIEKYIPPMVMVILVTYCFVGIDFSAKPYGLPEIISALFVAVVHLRVNNALISIFGGTVLYMVFLSL